MDSSRRLFPWSRTHHAGLADVPPSPDTKTDWLEAWLDRFERVLRGGISENPDDFQRRLVNSPKPSYPALAQRAGLQGS